MSFAMAPGTSLPSGSLTSLRRGNLELLIRHLAVTGPAHRAQLARIANVTRTTASNLVNELLAAEVVVETAIDDDRVDGRAGPAIALSDQLWTAGVESTLDTVSVNLRTASGTTLRTSEAIIAPDSDWQVRRDEAVRLLRRTLDLHDPAGRLLAVGIGVPGQVGRDGRVTAALPDQPWGGVNVRDVMQDELGVPVLVDNNVRMETFAESRWGAALGEPNTLYVHVASGIAVGMILDGALVRGDRGFAGELGHLSVDIDGPPCACGNRGCLVLVAGRAAIMRSFQEHWDQPRSWREALEHAARGEGVAHAVFSEVGATLGKALAGVANVLAPSQIILGGDIALAGPVVADAVALALHERSLSSRRAIPVVLSQLGGGPAIGAAGAAAMVWADEETGSRIIDALLA